MKVGLYVQLARIPKRYQDHLKVRLAVDVSTAGKLKQAEKNSLNLWTRWYMLILIWRLALQISQFPADDCYDEVGRLETDETAWPQCVCWQFSWWWHWWMMVTLVKDLGHSVFVFLANCNGTPTAVFSPAWNWNVSIWNKNNTDDNKNDQWQEWKPAWLHRELSVRLLYSLAAS